MPTLVDICFAISPLDAGPLTLTPNLSGMDVTLGGSLIKHISDSPAGTFTQDAMGHFTHHVTHDAAGNALEWDLSDGHLVGTAHSDGLGHVSFHDPFGALQGTLEGGSAGHATYSDANHAHVFDFHHGMSLDASPGFGSDDGFHGQDWSSATHNDFGSVAAFEAPATSHAFSSVDFGATDGWAGMHASVNTFDVHAFDFDMPDFSGFDDVDFDGF